MTANNTVMDTGELGLGDLSALGRLEQWPVARLFSVAARMAGPVWGRLAERQSGVSATGFFLLRILLVKDGLRPGELADLLRCTPATVTSVVDTLVRDGYVRRGHDDTDRRAVLLHLTDSGRALTHATGAEIGGDLRRLYHVDEADEPAVRRYLLAVIGRFEEFLEGDHVKGPRP